MTFLSLLSVLFAATMMGYFALGKDGGAAAQVEEIDQDSPRQRPIPRRWSNLLIAMAVVYCFLLLAGLSWAGWFRLQ